VNVCVPVLKRYDLLRELLSSLNESTLREALHVCIIDNGRNDDEIAYALGTWPGRRTIAKPDSPMGVAESWNWFIENVPEERLIVNDDVTFSPDAIERIVETPGNFITPLRGANAFSCFLIRDACIRRVGRFDESISPGYAYFEDCDYAERMILAREPIFGTAQPCAVAHGGSKTLERFSNAELDEHHRKFKIAQRNFEQKWGRPPDANRYVDWTVDPSPNELALLEERRA
jgi:GT2 family glycosyltransferase